MTDEELLRQFKDIDRRWAKMEEDEEDALLDGFINAKFGKDEDKDEQR